MPSVASLRVDDSVRRAPTWRIAWASDTSSPPLPARRTPTWHAVVRLAPAELVHKPPAPSLHASDGQLLHIQVPLAIGRVLLDVQRVRAIRGQLLRDTGSRESDEASIPPAVSEWAHCARCKPVQRYMAPIDLAPDAVDLQDFSQRSHRNGGRSRPESHRISQVAISVAKRIRSRIRGYQFAQWVLVPPWGRAAGSRIGRDRCFVPYPGISFRDSVHFARPPSTSPFPSSH
jgi:hypothetical protein